MTNSILTGWNIPRVLRLVLGAIIIIQGIQTTGWLAIAAGILFSLTALFNVGCCSVGTCSVPLPKKQDQTKPVDYKETK